MTENTIIIYNEIYKLRLNILNFFLFKRFNPNKFFNFFIYRRLIVDNF